VAAELALRVLRGPRVAVEAVLVLRDSRGSKERIQVFKGLKAFREIKVLQVAAYKAHKDHRDLRGIRAIRVSSALVFKGLREIKALSVHRAIRDSKVSLVLAFKGLKETRVIREIRASPAQALKVLRVSKETKGIKETKVLLGPVSKVLKASRDQADPLLFRSPLHRLSYLQEPSSRLSSPFPVCRLPRLQGLTWCGAASRHPWAVGQVKPSCRSSWVERPWQLRSDAKYSQIQREQREA
jgi:hypothetical protein